MPIAIIPMTEEYRWTLLWQGWILSAVALGYITSQVSAVRSGYDFKLAYATARFL